MQRVEPIIGELQTSQSPILTVSHQAILRCIIGYFMDKKPEELPYMEVPLHTIIRISSQGFKNRIELIPLGIECVNTMRHKPQDCSDTRTADDALITVPAHYEIPNPWRGLGSTAPTLVQQHWVPTAEASIHHPGTSEKWRPCLLTYYRFIINSILI